MGECRVYYIIWKIIHCTNDMWVFRTNFERIFGLSTILISFIWHLPCTNMTSINYIHKIYTNILLTSCNWLAEDNPRWANKEIENRKEIENERREMFDFVKLYSYHCTPLKWSIDFEKDPWTWCRMKSEIPNKRTRIMVKSY